MTIMPLRGQYKPTAQSSSVDFFSSSLARLPGALLSRPTNETLALALTVEEATALGGGARAAAVLGARAEAALSARAAAAAGALGGGGFGVHQLKIPHLCSPISNGKQLDLVDGVAIGVDFVELCRGGTKKTPSNKMLSWFPEG
jgi:hypothetical protein